MATWIEHELRAIVNDPSPLCAAGEIILDGTGEPPQTSASGAKHSGSPSQIVLRPGWNNSAGGENYEPGGQAAA